MWFDESHHFITLICASDKHNVTVAPSTVCDYGYWANGGLACFTHYLLPKIRNGKFSACDREEGSVHTSKSLAVPQMEEEEVLDGSRVLVAMENVCSY